MSFKGGKSKTADKLNNCKRKYNGREVYLLESFSFSKKSPWVLLVSLHLFPERKSQQSISKPIDRDVNRTKQVVLLRIEFVHQPFGTLAAVWRRWFIPLTTNVDFGSGRGCIDFQKALACSIVSAELPEKITVDTSAILFFRFQGCTASELYALSTGHPRHPRHPIPAFQDRRVDIHIPLWPSQCL